MKKVIKPSPVMLIIFAIASVICIAISIAGFIDTHTSSPEIICCDVFIIGVFIFYLIKFLSREKVEFDDESFTVDGTAYEFSDISKVYAEPTQVVRGITTLKFDVYVQKECIFSFTKNESGAKEFIDLMEKHGVKIKVYE